MAEIFAEVAVLTALETSLHYRVPGDLSPDIRVGSRVQVPLGKRQAMGLVLSLSPSRSGIPEHIALRPITSVLDPDALLTPDLVDLCRWMSGYYFYPIGEVVRTVLPVGTKDRHPRSSPRRTRKTKIVRLLSTPPADLLERNAKLSLLACLLGKAGGALPAKEVRGALANADYWLRKFSREGWVGIEEQEEEAPEFHCAQDFLPDTPLELTADQLQVLDTVLPVLSGSQFEPFVLHGVTGSGKTEIYLRLVEQVLREGRGSLVLVPEIALSTQMEALFRQRFGSCLAVWHSGLPSRMRSKQWLDILSGERRIVLGARSAVFTPVKDLGLVIVDEEHDSSYKQEDHLRYNARDVALMRAKILGVPVVLGSATPSLQTVYNCRQGKYGALTLPVRVLNRPLPEPEIVDMRREGGKARIFSHALERALKETLEAGRQALLFLNRRGFSKFFLCNVCGHALQCPHCTVTLTYHKAENLLRCHFCGWEASLPDRCPVCSQASLFAHGFGTERLEKEARRLFPGARVIRMDRDTMQSPEDLLNALNAMRRKEVDILVGTQMIAKGHDFPNITLVGVINADTGLQVPDFRAGETMVQLLLQVTGRAGRGEESGRVILQTYNPDHFTIGSVLKMDYAGFCERELRSREMLQYPPFTRLLRFLVTAKKEEAAREGARRLAVLCRGEAAAFKDSGKYAAVLGPSPAPHLKLKSFFRWHLFVKTWDNATMQAFAESVLARAKTDLLLRRVLLSVDRDPMTNL